MAPESRRHFLKYFGSCLLYFLYSCSKRSNDPLGPTGPSGTVSGSSITVSPASVSMAGGGQKTFTAKGGTGSYTWSVSDSSLGLISSSGVFTAGNTAGTLSVIATDSLANTGSANVTIIAGTITIAPSSATVATGESQTFTASGGAGTYTWSLSDPGLGSITPGGAFTAGNSTGALTVTATDISGNTGNATVTIT